MWLGNGLQPTPVAVFEFEPRSTQRTCKTVKYTALVGDHHQAGRLSIQSMYQL